MRKLLLSSLFLMVTTGCGANVPEGTGHYIDHEGATEFIDRMVAEHEFDRDELQALFAEVAYKDAIIQAMERPAERVRPWHEYRDIFITEQRIAQGVEFWRQHQQTLQRAEQQWGVPAEVIVAIIGVETSYGRNKGRWRVLDALSTLAFDYPKRSPFFTRELEQFLILTREQGKAPLELVGSYAGAMGYGQFMPSSYRHYAHDFDGDGLIDIWDNPVDAIGSVANYFSEHGWQPNQPVVSRATVREEFDESVANQALKPEHTLGELAGHGFIAKQALSPDLAATAMVLEGKAGPEYWIGLENFYVITRYNHSRLYAMAVHQLGEKIRERME